MPTLILWILVAAALAGFALQVRVRVRLIAAAPNTFSFQNPGARVARFLLDVLGQRQTIAERPVVGLAHAFVFWGFAAFAGYTAVEFLRGLGVVDLTGQPWFRTYRIVLTPFAVAVLGGVTLLLIRRVIIRPAALGTTVSLESVVIGLSIAALMATFLLTWRLEEASAAGRANWWVHAILVLGLLVLIPASKHFHLVLSPITVLLKPLELGAIPNLDFDREEVGLETVKDLGSKSVLDALTCVECGRCQDNCPAFAAGQRLNPKAIVLQTQDALLAGDRDARLAGIYSEEALWQCTTCGACEKQCPVGIEHLPLMVGARRGLVSNGDAPPYLANLYSNLERRANIWGLGYDERQRFVSAAGLETFDPARHDVLVWLGCAGSFEADFQQSLRSLFGILRRSGVKCGVLAKENCTGDSAKRTGNEFVFRELAQANIDTLTKAGAQGATVLTSCPHCLKTLGADYERLGCRLRVVHSATFVEELTRDSTSNVGERETVTFHDPCYLGRYAGTVDEPRALLARAGASIAEPVRNRENPYCCGAGGGLLFADKEETPGARISDIRLRQLHDTGASTVVTACPFCSIMLKGAATSGGDAQLQFVDLMTYVDGRLGQAGQAGKAGGADQNDT